MNEILALGAESILFKTTRWNQTLALKWRQSKPYLLEEIDSQLRRSRTSRECKMLTIARTLGVRTPAVYSADYANHMILMDYVEGTQFKQLVEQISNENLVKLCHCFGESIGLLHKGDVVHGDPTTSNVIVDRTSQLWLVDFGLSEMNASVEMKGVDLHLIHRALETTHWDRQEIMLEATIDGYIQTLGAESEAPLARMKHIRERGRYH